MHKFLSFLFLLILVSTVSAQNKWELYNNSAYLSFLLTDYKTYKLHGGYLTEVPYCQECSKDSIPLAIIYHDPADFGDITFTYKPTADTIFYATTVWMGMGSRKYPWDILTADSFNFVNDSIPPPLSVEYYKYSYYLSKNVFIQKADSAWNAVKSLDIVKSFSRHGYRIGISLYTPYVGVFGPEGPFSPDKASWIIFLYRPRVGAGIKLSGKISYDNYSNDILDQTSITLSPGNFTAVSNKNGDYSVAGLSNGTYRIKTSASRIWRGVNATDALIIGRYINKLYPLSGLKLKAADADQNGSVSGWDMLSILRQITGNNSSWTDKWIFDDAAVIRSDTDIVKNIQGICRGDVNASYFGLPKIYGQNDSLTTPVFSFDDMKLSTRDTITISLHGKDLTDFGALTLKIQFNPDSLKFVGASEWNDNITESMIGESEGVITIAYANVNSKTIKDNNLVKLKFVSTSELKNFSVSFIKNECEIASYKAIPISAEFIDRQFTTGSGRTNRAIPAVFSLEQNYPNPFNPVTSIIYTIPSLSQVILKLYDQLGREVTTLVNKEQPSGEYKVLFNGSSLPSGIYIYTLQAGNFRESRKLILLK